MSLEPSARSVSKVILVMVLSVGLGVFFGRPVEERRDVSLVSNGPGVGSLPVPDAVETIIVHVSGAVASPGLVVLAPGSRVADAVEAAGGATSSADLISVNLAQAVVDGQQIVVPSPGDAPLTSHAGTSGVALNSADAAALETLPGVGPVLAASIVAYRDEHGPYADVEDLLSVPGIGESKLATLRDRVVVP